MPLTSKNVYKKILGRSGEKLAVKYLKKNKYEILATNYTTHVGEIDIIAKDKEYVVFVEVKTRTSDLFGMPSEAVNREKQRKYSKVAQEFLLKNGYTDRPCRFDVVEVINKEINHIINAFCM